MMAAFAHAKRRLARFQHADGRLCTTLIDKALYKRLSLIY
ncbi:hypothetical protein ALFP_2012 [Alcaligenes faecalis]|nr:hypothetical protein ALFP_2012 [Alcaligenes faecalis]